MRRLVFDHFDRTWASWRLNPHSSKLGRKLNSAISVLQHTVWKSA